MAFFDWDRLGLFGIVREVGLRIGLGIVRSRIELAFVIP